MKKMKKTSYEAYIRCIIESLFPDENKTETSQNDDDSGTNMLEEQMDVDPDKVEGKVIYKIIMHLQHTFCLIYDSNLGFPLSKT